MEVHVKLYGPFTFMSGRREFTLQINRENVNVNDFLTLLVKKIPKLKQALDGIDIEKTIRHRLMLMVNGKQFVNASNMIHDGDQVQLLTPVAGG